MLTSNLAGVVTALRAGPLGCGREGVQRGGLGATLIGACAAVQLHHAVPQTATPGVASRHSPQQPPEELQWSQHVALAPAPQHTLPVAQQILLLSEQVAVGQGRQCRCGG